MSEENTKPLNFKGYPEGQPVGTRPIKYIKYLAECPQCGEICEEIELPPEPGKSWQLFYCNEDKLQFVADFQ